MIIKTIITDNSLASATIGDKTFTRRTQGGQVIYDGAAGGSGGSGSGGSGSGGSFPQGTGMVIMEIWTSSDSPLRGNPNGTAKKFANWENGDRLFVTDPDQGFPNKWIEIPSSANTSSTKIVLPTGALGVNYPNTNGATGGGFISIGRGEIASRTWFHLRPL